MLLLHELTRKKTGSTHLSSITPASGDHRHVPPLHEVETGYDPVAWQPRSIKEHSPNVPDLVTADQQDSLVVDASAARADVREDRYHPCVIDNTSIRGSPPDRPALHEVETGYDPVAWQHRSTKEHSLIVPDLVTADQPDSLVVNASAARVDAREDRQHPSVIDNTGIRGSPSGGPALHEVETGYDAINIMALSSMLLLHALTREKTGITHVSSITPASEDRRQVDMCYTK
ncbi:hypothetical protein V5799_013173 [Amblyomma americanum]|uniref:Uncharacterized protein n=1 Tax=Amblyomma americanum TaxID=6943 RepID=A0AAQ4E6P6_AMBAM